MNTLSNSYIEPYHKNICIIPFVHIASRADGAVHLCCRSLKVLEESSKPLSLGANSLDEIWNGSEIKAVRLSMLKGRKLPECRNCWNEEKNGKKSKRIKENNSFLKFNYHRLKSAKDNKGFLSSLPLSLELKSGNSCNLKCRTCNPLSSSLWQKELKHHEKQWKSSSILKSAYEDAFHLSKQITKWHETDIFFQTIKKISQNLKLIYITGGEPLLIKSVSQVIDYLIKTDAYKNITLRINSNITFWKSAFFNKISQFKLVEFYPSLDAVGEKNDWLRPPSQFSKIEKHIEKLLLLSSNVEVKIECTVSAYNVLYITELIEWTRKLAKNIPPLPVYFNILHQPEFQHFSLLTKSLKQKVIKHYTIFKQEKKEMLYKSEIEGINYVINTLKSSLEDTEKITNLRRSLKEHTITLDRWRKENFSSVFPELVELLNQE
ncbi:MAG: twitch domain-containing radical SAM protein [Oligoflexia bacterium]|nr:twitch domain-containing radical SAM protein [Oligoflexia bacterium]